LFVEIGQNGLFEQDIVTNIAKPEGFVSGHGVDDAGLQLGIGRRAEPLEEVTQRADLVLLHQTAETAGHQILLTRTKLNTAGILQVLLERRVVRRVDQRL